MEDRSELCDLLISDQLELNLERVKELEQRSSEFVPPVLRSEPLNPLEIRSETLELLVENAHHFESHLADLRRLVVGMLVARDLLRVKRVDSLRRVHRVGDQTLVAELLVAVLAE